MAFAARSGALLRLLPRSAVLAGVLALAGAAPVADASGAPHAARGDGRGQGKAAAPAEAPALQACCAQPGAQHRTRHEAPAPVPAVPHGQPPAAAHQQQRHGPPAQPQPPARAAASEGEATAPPSKESEEGLLSGTRAERERQRRITERELHRQAKQGQTQGAAPRPVLQPAAPSAPTATTAATTPAPVITPAAAPAVATTTAAGPTAVPAKPKAGRSKHTRHTATAHAGGRGQDRARLSAATAGAVAAAAAAARPLAPASGTGGRSAKPAPSHAHAESAIVTSVTKFIDVVPSWVRIVIGALVALAIALAVSSRVAALRARRLGRQRRALLADVGLLQAALLPALPGRIGPIGTTAAYRPASGPAAGGDFFDVFALADGQVGVIVGDVSGHGREALPHTTLVRYTLRAYLEAGLSPRGALQTAAPVLERQLGDSFATVVLATYNPRSRRLVYSSAGHPPPLVTGEIPIVPITACSAPPIGVGRPTGTRQTSVSVPGAATICFYTDGVVESRLHGELYGPERLAHTLAELGDGATAEDLLDNVSAEAEKLPDDMAAVLLHVEGPAAEARVNNEELEVDRGEASRNRAERFLLAGGLKPAVAAEVLGAARDAVRQYGRVVIELQMSGDMAPQVKLHPQNIAVLESPLRDAAAAGSASR